MKGVVLGFGLILLAMAAFWAAERVIEWRAEVNPHVTPAEAPPVAALALARAA